jgi:superfamily I DNA/RNA helicase
VNEQSRSWLGWLHSDPQRLRADLARHQQLDARPLAESQPRRDIPLDAAQASAAFYGRGPLRVLAPAGSGKTRTLTARIAYLVESGVRPDQILALAFNTRAAAEMRERLSELGIAGINTETFHALGLRLLRDRGTWTLDEARYDELVNRTIMESTGSPASKKETQRLRKLLHEYRANLVPLIEMQGIEASDLDDLSALLEAFHAKQEAEQVLNFDDMIYLVIRYLLINPDWRGQWQRQFEFVLVDEFQDLNQSQLILMQLLALPHNNLFVVGDDDQMIYGWRGAAVANILDFEATYPTAQSIVLETNYRSSRAIVKAARKLIGFNPVRVAKDFRARPKAPPGQVELRTGAGLAAQLDQIGAWLYEVADEGGELGADTAILARLNREAEQVRDALDQIGLRTQLHGDDDLEATADLRAIQIMTVHKAKGKEFPNVVYFNLSRKATKSTSLEAEERRVAYVGVTRAIQRLLITTDTRRPSGFVRETLLNSSWDDYATCHLERRLSGRWARFCFAQSRGLSKLTAWFNGRYGPAPDQPLTSDLPVTVRELMDEIRFRRRLGVPETARPSAIVP